MYYTVLFYERNYVFVGETGNLQKLMIINSQEDKEKIHPSWLRVTGLFESEKEELLAYLKGDLRTLKSTDSLVKKAKGTPFQQAVWQEVARIPYGETRSYSELAQAIGKPKAVRAVGGAINKNPYPIFIPCHRVIGKNGKLRGYAGGIDLKEDLLQMEASQGL